MGITRQNLSRVHKPAGERTLLWFWRLDFNTFLNKTTLEIRVIILYKNNADEEEQSDKHVLRVNTSVEVVIIGSQGNCAWGRISGLSQGQCLSRGFKQQIIGEHMHTETYQKDIGRAHELAPQCVWTYSVSVWSPH